MEILFALLEKQFFNTIDIVDQANRKNVADEGVSGRGVSDPESDEKHLEDFLVSLNYQNSLDSGSPNLDREHHKMTLFEFFGELILIRKINSEMMKRICFLYESRVTGINLSDECNIDSMKIPSFLLSSDFITRSNYSSPQSSLSNISHPSTSPTSFFSSYGFFDSLISVLIEVPRSTSPFHFITLIELLSFLVVRFPESILDFVIDQKLNFSLVTLLFHPYIPLRIVVLKCDFVFIRCN
jgi:hypothetical protein